ncbi:MAG TPA: DoxX family protein [Gemmatimonadaceae bacterium]|nr:DoxX family protein [Gemmatimonadaceae bacterium]
MDTTRSLNAVVVWVVDVLVAILFLAVGVPKVLGLETNFFQFAAMHGFPDWIRIVVGVCEIVGAIGLLIPRVSAYAALLLAMLMVPASITQAMSGEPGIYIPIVLFVVLLILAERRNSTVVRNTIRSIAQRPHPLLRNGAIAGIIGATCVAGWFFIVDIVNHTPFVTPLVMGHAMVTLLRPTPGWASSPLAIILVYTVFHYLAFIAVGIVAAIICSWARSEPSILLGFVVLFATVEVGFYGYVAVLAQASDLHELAWYQVMIGNLIAAAGMGFYLWRAYPRLSEEFSHAMSSS